MAVHVNGSRVITNHMRFSRVFAIRDCREGGDIEFSILNRQNLLVLVNFITDGLRCCLV
jgi:hypothetical protein